MSTRHSQQHQPATEYRQVSTNRQTGRDTRRPALSYAITVDKTVYTSVKVRVAVWHDPCIELHVSLPNGMSTVN